MTGIQLDEKTLDLKISGGSLALGCTAEQNQYLILAAFKGEFKQYPLLGVGISGYTCENGYAGLKWNVLNSFKQDSLSIDSIEIVDGKLKIEAKYDRV